MSINNTKIAKKFLEIPTSYDVFPYDNLKLKNYKH